MKPISFKNFPNFISKSVLAAGIITALSSCQAANTPSEESNIKQNDGNMLPFPAVLDLFACKPNAPAFVAAHRGTHEGSEYPENALESLQALHAAGVKFAEIDVARLKDGTHILFHDGTWERSTTGKGPVVSTDAAAADKLLLKTTDGDITSFRPSHFSDVVSWAKDKMYLEVDFKTSASEQQIIKMLKDNGMLDQVILISYSTDQALRLHKLAPEAALSVSISKPGDIKALEARGIPAKVMTAWTGGRTINPTVFYQLREKNIPILKGSFFDLDDPLQISKDFKQYVKFADQADLVVSDFSFDTQRALMLTNSQQRDLDKCLKGKG